MKKKTLEFLESHQSETSSTWREEAEWRRDNWSWLRHSQNIVADEARRPHSENSCRTHGLYSTIRFKNPQRQGKHVT